jgi:hypothetical protein
MHYSTIPYFSVTLLFHFFFNFIWLACYNLQTYLPQVSEENGQESTSWIMVSSETECFSLNISLHTYSSIFDFRQIIYQSCASCACIYRLQRRLLFFFFLTKEKACVNMHMSPHVVLFFKTILYPSHPHACSPS